MNLYKALFLCLLLMHGFSVDRLLQASGYGGCSDSKGCADPDACLFSCRTQPVDESDGYPQAWLSSVLSPSYGPGSGWVFHSL
jgi:hypothetical protein